MTPTWTILIATLAWREKKLGNLLGLLLPQLEQAGGAVTVEALWNKGERLIGEYRQSLLEHASSEYVCFIDDDDEVARDYVTAILPLLDGVDYVGFRAVAAGWNAGTACCKGWSEDVITGECQRDISHLNPIKRKLALLSRFDGAFGEDYRWASRLTGQVCTEHYLDRVMYHYHPSDLAKVTVRVVQQMSGPYSDRAAWPDAGGIMELPWAEASTLLGDDHSGPVVELLYPEVLRSEFHARPVIESPYFSWHPESSESA